MNGKPNFVQDADTRKYVLRHNNNNISKGSEAPLATVLHYSGSPEKSFFIEVILDFTRYREINGISFSGSILHNPAVPLIAFPLHLITWIQAVEIGE